MCQPASQPARLHNSSQSQTYQPDCNRSIFHPIYQPGTYYYWSQSIRPLIFIIDNHQKLALWAPCRAGRFRLIIIAIALEGSSFCSVHSSSRCILPCGQNPFLRFSDILSSNLINFNTQDGQNWFEISFFLFCTVAFNSINVHQMQKVKQNELRSPSTHKYYFVI